uniref:Uncharacterized protein n=1 Tax=Globisporangium ultimum (strain ATCC 200006 / CBS 805.95 / DAOM BR144) TaxID=431595 RepID=K3WSQ6_GLOUD
MSKVDLARTSLTTVQNLSFPNAMTSLNISGNAVTRIAGVTFPASLEYLHFNSIGPITASDAESTASVFEEFEVRQTDATRFARLTVFDVAVTTKVTCSDSRAKRTYVQDTMLCVLPDDVFLSKYGLASNTNTAASSTATPVPVLDEDMDQSRSWFLLIGGGLLSAFVVPTPSS